MHSILMPSNASLVTDQLFGVIFLAVVIGLTLAAFVRHLRMTPEERTALSEARLANEAAEQKERAARLMAAATRELDRTEQMPGPRRPIPGLMVWGWVLAVLGGLLLGCMLLLARELGSDVTAADVFNARLVLSMLGCTALLAAALCFCAQRLIEALARHPQ